MSQLQKSVHESSQIRQSSKVSKQLKFSFKNVLDILHSLGKEQKDSDEELKDLKNLQSSLKNRKNISKEYIPLGSIVDNTYIKKPQIDKLNFQNIFLHSNNEKCTNKIVFKHNQTNKQIRFYLPTFLRFSLIKLHSEDLKNITHIENKNNMIIYIHVYSRGLPKMLVDKLTKRYKIDQGNTQEPKLLFRANRHLFEAMYYSSYDDYLIFMFNPFSEKMVEFQILKNVMFAPFQEAELILNIRLNKKIFKLEGCKTIKISKSFQVMDQTQQQTPNEIENIQFNKIILEFKIQKPRNIIDSFRYHKSIEFGNYGIMTNEIHINNGTYLSPAWKKTLDQQKEQSQKSEILQDQHLAQLQDISTLRLSIGLYKHPVTQLCTFFIPMMLSGGLTLLLFHLCDHDLTNELQVLAIILVAYGAFIPEFRDRISMSRTVIILDFYIVYNMIPAVLCAMQSIAQSRDKVSYNSYHVISVIMYYVSALILAQIYILYLYIDTRYFRKHYKDMISNFNTNFLETKIFDQSQQKPLSWFVTNDLKQRAYFCEKESQDELERANQRLRNFFKRSSLYTSHVHCVPKSKPQVQVPLSLEMKVSEHTNRKMRQVKQDQYQQDQDEHHELLYRTKAIQNERHIHSFQKIINKKLGCILISIIIGILALTCWLSWKQIYNLYTFQDTNRNCIHDDNEDSLRRVQDIIAREQNLQQQLKRTIQYEQLRNYGAQVHSRHQTGKFYYNPKFRQKNDQQKLQKNKEQENNIQKFHNHQVESHSKENKKHSQQLRRHHLGIAEYNNFSTK